MATEIKFVEPADLSSIDADLHNGFIKASDDPLIANTVSRILAGNTVSRDRTSNDDYVSLETFIILMMNDHPFKQRYLGIRERVLRGLKAYERVGTGIEALCDKILVSAGDMREGWVKTRSELVDARWILRKYLIVGQEYLKAVQKVQVRDRGLYLSERHGETMKMTGLLVDKAALERFHRAIRVVENEMRLVEEEGIQGGVKTKVEVKIEEFENRL